MASEYCDYVIDLLAPLRGVTARRMFGGYGLFRGGLMFGIIIDDVLYFKVSAKTQSEYEALEAQPLRYGRKGKSVALSYWNVPAAILDDEDLIIAWAEKACATARDAQDKKPRKLPAAKNSGKMASAKRKKK